MAGEFRVTEVAAGMMRVEHDGRFETVYVAGPPADRWAFWNGTVFRADLTPQQAPSRGRRGAHAAQPLSAPMPATVIQVLIRVGDTVRKGDTVVLLEAMKMELPVRAPADAVVRAVRCRDGELVDADAVLVELA
jgi:biotin carboxyl carrier protein